MTDELSLWRYFRDVREAVEAANRGAGTHPYRSGTFMVTAIAGDIEMTISDVSEEDAVLIAGELSEMGVKALLRASVICPSCETRVPEQDYCIKCRAKLP